MKSIIITGSNGFIGSYIKKYYIEQNYKVISINRRGISSSEENIIIDISKQNFRQIVDKYKPIAIIHCAGLGNVSDSLMDPISDYEANVTTVYNLIESIRYEDYEIKVIFLSSAAVYGEQLVIPIKEEQQLMPISPYGMHKKIAEELLQFYSSQYKFSLRIARVFSVYGPGLKKQILWDLCSRSVNNDYLLFGSGNEIRDYIYIEDLIQAINLLVYDDGNKVIFNIGNGEGVSIKQVSEIFRLVFDTEYEFSFANENLVGNPMNYIADTERIKALGYKSKITLPDGIRKYCDWLKEII